MSASTPSDALSQSGIPCSKQVELDGRIHRFKTTGDREENSWYVFKETKNVVYGSFGCWKRQFTERWSSVDFNQMSDEQKRETREGWQASQKIREAEELRLRTEAKTKAAVLFRDGNKVLSHPYLEAKSIKPLGEVRLSNLEITKDWLAVPLQDETGTIHSAQFIADDGTKKFLYGGRVQGCYCLLPGKEGGPILICEGYATGCSLNTATGWTTVCAMNCGNLLLVGQSMRRLHKDKSIVFCADNDQFTDDNPGIEKARKAAVSTKAIIAHPEFGDEALIDKPTDFNDLHRLEGILEVRRQVEQSFPVFARSIGDAQKPPENDPNELLKHRFLSKRGSLLMSGPAGMGKSSFLMQCLALWSNNLPCFGIQPTRALRAVLVQAENDEGDLAEMRDGVCKGLQFNEQQRFMFFERVRFYTSEGLVGKRFCEENLRPLLDLHDPDLIAIDPALSFLGGDVKEQKIVGDFLRVLINPLIYSHSCAVVVMHHTNKPTQGKEKAEWRNGELAYLGSGSAEWANWARAILSLQSTGETGIYKLHAAKRGARVGWRDSDDNAIYEKLIRHSKEKGVIYWTEADEPAPKQAQADSPRAGRRNKVDEIAFSNLHDFCSACTEEGEGKNEISLRLESYLAKNKIDVSPSTCKLVIEKMVFTEKLRKGENFRYYKGAEA